MSDSDDSNSIDPKKNPTPRTNSPESAGLTGWLDRLNTFLDHALKADIDTGC